MLSWCCLIAQAPFMQSCTHNTLVSVMLGQTDTQAAVAAVLVMQKTPQLQQCYTPKTADIQQHARRYTHTRHTPALVSTQEHSSTSTHTKTPPPVHPGTQCEQNEPHKAGLLVGHTPPMHTHVTPCVIIKTTHTLSIHMLHAQGGLEYSTEGCRALCETRVQAS
jgi:hypothetical protein